MKKLKADFLLTPWATIIGMVTGIIIGIYGQQIIPYIKPVGEIYLSILQMSVIPIMASAIVMSIGKLLMSEEASRYLAKLIRVFVIFLLGVSLVSILISIIVSPFIASDNETKKAIGKMMLSSSTTSSTDTTSSITVIKEIDSRYNNVVKKEEQKLSEFIYNMIPKNIFEALNKGENLKIIFFFFIFGIMMKYISNKASNNIISMFEGIFEAFQKVIKTTMYFLPFGICSLMAVQFSNIGVAFFASVLKFILLIYSTALIIFLISTFVIYKKSGTSYANQFKHLGEAIMIAFGTRNSFATIPSIITGLHKGMGFNEDKVNLATPLGITLCRYGNVMIFSTGAVFAVQLYNSPMNLQTLFMIAFTAVMAGMATSGAPGMVARTMISMVLAPIGIPSEAIIVMLMKECLLVQLPY